jgi:hypothetical protein
MSNTARLQLPYILTSQAQKEVTHNSALNLLDIFTRPSVLEMDKDTPPVSPTVGDCYVVGGSPTDEFVSHEDEIACYTDNGWIFAAPFKWLDVVNDDDDTRYTYDGSAWVPFGLLMKDTGDYLRVSQLTEDITLSGATTNSTIDIPDRAIVMAVNVRVITAITGATSFDVGVAAEDDRYGSTVGVVLDSTNVGMSLHPTTYYADTSILFTANGSNFTAGEVRLSIQYFESRGAWDF